MIRGHAQKNYRKCKIAGHVQTIFDENVNTSSREQVPNNISLAAEEQPYYHSNSNYFFSCY
jgi:hypothetical protein